LFFTPHKKRLPNGASIGYYIFVSSKIGERHKPSPTLTTPLYFSLSSYERREFQMPKKAPVVPHIVVQEESTTNLTTVFIGVSVASILPPNEEQMKFFIGLRLLGEEKQARYLTYLRQLTESTQQPEGEAANEF